MPQAKLTRPQLEDHPWLSIIFKTIILGLLAAACAYLLFFPLSPLSHVHVKELVGMGHRGAAFCAFTKACQSAEEAGTFGSIHTEAGHPKHRHPVLLAKPAIVTKGAHNNSKTEEPNQTAIAQAQHALSARVCGSPAMDAYTKVNATCLQQSPTNQWYQAYYKAGGKQGDLVITYDEAASYDGLAVAWGLTNKKKSVEECAAHCSRHMPGDIPGPFSMMPCNTFVFCPTEECWEPDAHHSTFGDCWLKFTEGPARPEVNVRGDIPDAMRKRHPEAPMRVQWVSGVLLPRGVALTNGTWSPRQTW